MKLDSRGCTRVYALLQSLYWVSYCLMGCYASVFMLNRGFTNGTIGLVLGCSYAFSALLQPLIAALFVRRRVRLNAGMLLTYIPVFLVALMMAATRLTGLALAAAMILMLTLQSAMQPSLNSLPRGFDAVGAPINFGLARGLGSLAYAVVSTLVGRLLKSASPDILPTLYSVTLLALIVMLALFRVPINTAPAAADARPNQKSLLVREPRFALYLLGILCLSVDHIFIDSYMLQILRAIGGDSAELGIAVGIAAAVELPAMLLYAPLSQRVDCGRIQRLAGLCWVVKNLLITLARSPAAIYAAELLQFASYALYVPASVDYIAHALGEHDFLQGQALAGSAWTLGSVCAAFAGGPLIDAIGIPRTQWCAFAFSLLGAALFFIAIPRRTSART